MDIIFSIIIMFWRKFSQLFLQLVSTVFLIFTVTFGAGATTEIRFPDEELASEYVFPVFDTVNTILERNVTLTYRLEFRLAVNMRIDEPVYHPVSAFGSMAFYWNESSGIGLSSILFWPGLSNTTRQLQTEGVPVTNITKRRITPTKDSDEPRTQANTLSTSSNTTNNIEEIQQKRIVYYNPLLAPRPLYAAFLNYYFSPFYGKISLSKTWVLNFSLYSFIGLGVISFKHGSEALVMNPASHLGLGQKFYFNRYTALDLGMNMLIYKGPNPVSPALKWDNTQTPPIRPPYREFRPDFFIRFLVYAGMTFLI